jgi:transcription elongation GreA/GreB family factor
MDKASLLADILTALAIAQTQALNAAAEAHETATHTENVAENKYDTLGLEAAYLAHGQSQRVLTCSADLKAFERLRPTPWQAGDAIDLGALICLRTDDADAASRWLYLGPGAGGLRMPLGGTEVVVVTPAAPLGQQLLGRYLGDDISIMVAGKQQDYAIKEVL